MIADLDDLPGTATSGVAWWAVDRVDSSIAQRSVDALAPDDPSIRTAPAAGDAGTATAENILVLGLDTRPADQVAPAEARPRPTS